MLVSTVPAGPVHSRSCNWKVCGYTLSYYEELEDAENAHGKHVIKDLRTGATIAVRCTPSFFFLVSGYLTTV